MASPIELVEIKRVQEFIEKYTKGFPHHHPSSSGGRPGNVVLLTGSTGQLGTALLTQLALCDNVTKIYAFNRRSKTETTMKQRHYEAFIERGLDIAILESPKVVFVEGDTSDATLGISKELFSEVSPAPIPEAPADVRKIATNSGYSAAKCVCERMLEIASQKTTLRPTIVRICQLTGYDNGNWGGHEWIPGLFRSAEVVGCLPNNRFECSWMPTMPAAKALVEMLSSPHLVLHLAHPRRTSFSTLVRYGAEAYNIPIVPWSEWLSKLEAVARDPNVPAAVKKQPAIVLIRIFRELDEDSLGDAELDTTRAVQVADAMGQKELPRLNKEDVHNWVAFWKNLKVRKAKL